MPTAAQLNRLAALEAKAPASAAGPMAGMSAGSVREAVMSLSGVAGYKETAIKPFVKLSANFTPDFPLDLVRNNTEMTITAELANGKVYTLSGAWLEGETSAKGDDGTVDLEFAGLKGIWQ